MVTRHFQLPEFGTGDLQRYMGNIGRHDDADGGKQGTLKLSWSMLDREGHGGRIDASRPGPLRHGSCHNRQPSQQTFAVIENDHR